MKTRFLTFIVMLIIIALPNIGQAQIPRTLSYQGVLSDETGSPKPDGSYTFTFSLYDASLGGTAIWTETKTLDVTRGLFHTVLGDEEPFGASLEFDEPYWLGILVAGEPELSPRIPLTSVGYSFNALRADTASFALSAAGAGDGHSLDADDGDPVDAVYVDGDGDVGIGTTSPASSLHIMRTGAAALRLENSSYSTVWLGTPTTSGTGGLGTTTNHDFPIFTNNTDRLMIKANGNVGIGTTNPGAKLDVNGDVKLGWEGTVFQSIKVITGTTNASGGASIFYYPLDWYRENTYIISGKIFLSNLVWVSAEGNGNYWALYETYGKLFYPDLTGYHSVPYKLVIMRVD